MLNNYDMFKNDDWSILIILDACRFDYFSCFYKYFFDGVLTKVFSLGSHTSEWCINTFREYYDDIVYISANPFINSLCKTGGFSAKDHFYKVIDVWDFGWSDKLGTVHPEVVTYTALRLKNRYPGKRFIVHYLQPHAPYISQRFFSEGFSKEATEALIFCNKDSSRDKRQQLITLYRKVLTTVSTISYKLFGLGNLYIWKLAECLNLPPVLPIDVARRKFGVNGLRKAYAENLIIVLKYVSFLVSNLLPSENIVITSDHGEFLGEEKMFDHIAGCYHPILRIVPWFKVTAVKGYLKDETYKLKLRYKIMRLRQNFVT